MLDILIGLALIPLAISGLVILVYTTMTIILVIAGDR